MKQGHFKTKRGGGGSGKNAPSRGLGVPRLE